MRFQTLAVAVGLVTGLVCPLRGAAQTAVAQTAVAQSAVAQTAAPPASSAVPARQADVSSPDAIIGALYASISGAAGERRNWDRFRSLFVPGARLIPTGGAPGQPARATMLSPDEYAQRAGPSLERDGFYEVEIARTTDEFGRILHAFSSYASRRKLTDPAPFARGINSIQLLNDGTRWWIVSVYWDGERPGSPIPAKYLTPGKP
jgi:hypothetical protein